MSLVELERPLSGLEQEVLAGYCFLGCSPGRIILDSCCHWSRKDVIVSEFGIVVKMRVFSLFGGQLSAPNQVVVLDTQLQRGNLLGHSSTYGGWE